MYAIYSIDRYHNISLKHFRYIIGHFYYFYDTCKQNRMLIMIKHVVFYELELFCQSSLSVTFKINGACLGIIHQVLEKRHVAEEILRQNTYGTNLIKTSSIKMRHDERLRNNENRDINISLWIFHILIFNTNISYYFIYIFFARSHIDTNKIYETFIERKYYKFVYISQYESYSKIIFQSQILTLNYYICICWGKNWL